MIKRENHTCSVGCYREMIVFGRIFSWCSRFSYKTKENKNYLKTDLENKLTKEQFKKRLAGEAVEKLA